VVGGVVLETCAAGVANGMLSRLASSVAAGLVARMQDKAALKNALSAALRATDETYGLLLGRFAVNEDFLVREGAAELALVLLPGRGPDARRLARGYMRSLGGAGLTTGSDALVEPFECLLEHLGEQLGRHKPFRLALAQVAATRSDTASKIDELELLEWVRNRFSFLPTAGIGSTEHVQLELGEVFVEPRGLHERRAGRKWSTRAEEQAAVLAERLRNQEITHTDYEVLLDRLDLQEGAGEHPKEPVKISELIRGADRVVVLGDPGTGKTTLLRYLALRHACLLLDGEAQVSPELGLARLPLYLRAGDFSRAGRRETGLRAFITPFLSETMQCPVAAERIEQIVERALRAGRCLILIDGLDEVTSPQDRTSVVASITEFVGAQQPRGNRIVCTSRISGYSAAPLAAEFVAVRLLEMDDATIKRFLGRYVPALERVEAPGKDPALSDQDARRTVNTLLEALRTTPGVQRLAANPLLLTALLLVHRTRGALPERRVDAYKAVTDALGHTWRVKQGVPETDLPDERRLTLWLMRLAAWMHRKRPEGSATLRDLLEQWGPLWADLQRDTWNPEVLDAADPASTDAGREILEFVDQIERHSGLLVERAPQRWGFPHLTFEEFYAGRALAFEGRATTRAAEIRCHLHDARYEEPILLALGLLGDQPTELQAVFEASVLAVGVEAQQLGLRPSPWEDLLGRDFRFALRALADDVPISPRLTDELIARAIDEALDPTSRTRFTAYRNALLDRIAALASVGAGKRVAHLLEHRLIAELTETEDARLRVIDLAARCPTHQPLPTTIPDRLIEIIATAADISVAERAVRVLGGVGQLHPSAVDRLIEIIATAADPVVAERAVRVLGGVGQLHPSAVDRLIEIIATAADPVVAVRAVRVLGGVGQFSASAIDRLIEIIATAADRFVAARAADVLGGVGQFSVSAVDRLIEIVATAADRFVAERAVRVLGGVDQLSASAVDHLNEIIATADRVVAVRAADVLGGVGQLRPSAVDRLIEIVASADRIVAVRAADVLGGVGQLRPSAVDRLIEIVASAADPVVAVRAADVLGGVGQLRPSAVDRLIEIVASADRVVAVRAADVLGGVGQFSVSAVDRLIEIVASAADRFVAVRAADVLGGVGQLHPSAVDRLIEIIATADRVVAECAADVVGRMGQFSVSAVDRLIEIIVTAADRDVAERAVRVLGGVGQLSASAVDHLNEIIATADRVVAVRAANVLGGVGQFSVSAVDRLIEIIVTAADRGVAERAARVLGGVGQFSVSAVDRLIEIVATADPVVAERVADVLGGVGQLHPSAVDHLNEIIVTATAPFIAVRAADVLGEVGQLSVSAVDRLIEIVAAADRFVAVRAVRVLGGVGQFSVSAVDRLIEIIATATDPVVAVRAADVLGGVGQLSASAVDGLNEIIATATDLSVAERAADVLGGVGQLSASAVDGLNEIIATATDLSVAERAADVVRGVGQLNPSAIDRLIEIIATATDPFVAERAARVLRGERQLNARAIDHLNEIIATATDPVVAERAADVVRGVGQLNARAVDHLNEIIATATAPFVAERAADVVRGVGQLNPSAIDHLNDIAADESVSSTVRHRLLSVVAASTQPSANLLARVLDRLCDHDNDVRKAAVRGLLHMARQPGWSVNVFDAVLNATSDPAFQREDDHEHRPGHDYAYDALWQLSQGNGGIGIDN
jgi:hypothetical protein